jgi:hypothetical protein
VQLPQDESQEKCKVEAEGDRPVFSASGPAYRTSLSRKTGQSPDFAVLPKPTATSLQPLPLLCRIAVQEEGYTTHGDVECGRRALPADTVCVRTFVELRQMTMWHCSRCGETIPENFDVCWHCGGNRDGTSAEDFQAEPDDPSVPDPGAESAGAESHAASSAAGGDVGRSGCLTRLEIAELACKILAVWALAQAALSITPLFLLLFLAFSDPGRAFAASFSAIIPVGEIIVGIFLWGYSRAIGRRMVRDDPMPVVSTDMDGEHLMSIAFAAIGIYAVWASSEDFFRKAVQILYTCREEGITYADFWANDDWNASFFGTLGSLALGMWLLLGSRGIVRIVRRIQGKDQMTNKDIAETGEPIS